MNENEDQAIPDVPAPEVALAGEPEPEQPAAVAADQTAPGADATVVAQAPETARDTAVMFDSAEDLAKWLDSLNACMADGAVADNPWEPARVAAAAVRAWEAGAQADQRSGAHPGHAIIDEIQRVTKVQHAREWLHEKLEELRKLL